jgi:hypothetical protein
MTAFLHYLPLSLRSLTEIVEVTTQRCVLRGCLRVRIGAGHSLAGWENRSKPVRLPVGMTPRPV